MSAKKHMITLPRYAGHTMKGEGHEGIGRRSHRIIYQEHTMNM
jgi:hypothetical protein